MTKALFGFGIAPKLTQVIGQLTDGFQQDLGFRGRRLEFARGTFEFPREFIPIDVPIQIA